MAEEERTNKKVNVEQRERKIRLIERRRALSNRIQHDRNETMEKIFAKQNPVRTVIFFLSLNHNADVFMPRVFLEPFYRQTMVFGDWNERQEVVEDNCEILSSTLMHQTISDFDWIYFCTCIFELCGSVYEVRRGYTKKNCFIHIILPRSYRSQVTCLSAKCEDSPWICWRVWPGYDFSHFNAAQLGERWSGEREVAHSNPGQTNIQGL